MTVADDRCNARIVEWIRTHRDPTITELLSATASGSECMGDTGQWPYMEYGVTLVWLNPQGQRGETMVEDDMCSLWTFVVCTPEEKP